MNGFTNSVGLTSARRHRVKIEPGVWTEWSTNKTGSHRSRDYFVELATQRKVQFYHPSLISCR